MVCKLRNVYPRWGRNNWHSNEFWDKWRQQIDLNDITQKALHRPTIAWRQTVGSLNFWTTKTSYRINKILVQNEIYFIDDLTETSVETLQSFGLKKATIRKINEILGVQFGRDFKGLPWSNIIR